MWAHTSQSSQDSDSGRQEINNWKQLGKKISLYVHEHTCIHTHTHTYKVSFGGGKGRKKEGEKQRVGIQGILNSKVLEEFYDWTKIKHVILKSIGSN